MKVPAERLRQVLGITEVKVTAGAHPLALVDSTLDSSGMAMSKDK
jgi:hypothetical protein